MGGGVRVDAAPHMGSHFQRALEPEKVGMVKPHDRLVPVS